MELHAEKISRLAHFESKLWLVRVVSLGKLDDPLYQLIKLNGSTMRDLEFMQCTLPLSIMFNNSMKLCPNLTSFYYDVEGGSVMRGVLEDKQHWFIPDRPLDLEKLAIGQDAGYMPIYELIPWLPKLRSLSVGRSVQRPAELLQAIDRYCPDIERIVFTTARAVYGYVSKEKPAKPALKWFKIMYHDSFDEAVGIIPLLTKHYSTLEEFGVVFIQSVPSLTLRTLARLGGSNNLKTIKLGGLGEAEGATENLIAFLEASPQLEDISLDLDEIVTEGVAVALSRLQNVRTFELLRSGFLPVPALHELLKEWGRIGKLYFLIFRHNDTVYDMTLMAIASYLGCLRCLDFHDCPGITDEGLSIFSGLLHNLKHLNTFMVRDCEEVSPEVLSRTRAALEERVIMWYRYRI